MSGRSRQVLSAITQLRRSKHLPIVGSIGRVAPRAFFPRKTYVYGSGKRGHLVHWLHVAHLRALFVDGARRLELPLQWAQHRKHYRHVPDAMISLPENSWTLEVDNSTEGRSEGGIVGKGITSSTLIVAFKSEARFQNLSALGGLATYHGWFHEKERASFNILTEPVWWDGERYRGILESNENGTASR